MGARIITGPIKFDICLVPQPVTIGNVISDYWFKAERENCILFLIGGLAAGETATCIVMTAADSVGAGAAEYDNMVITANTNVPEITIDITDIDDPGDYGDLVTVNGVITTFAAAYSLANQEWNTTAHLAALINALCPELIAVATSATVVTVRVRIPGEDLITASTDNAVEIKIATVSAVAIYDISSHEVETTPFLTAKMATTATACGLSAVIMRRTRKSPNFQQFAAAGMDYNTIPI